MAFGLGDHCWFFSNVTLFYFIPSHSIPVKLIVMFWVGLPYIYIIILSESQRKASGQSV